MLGTSIAVIAGITYNFLPFTALPLYVALERIDKRMVEAGKDLYASRFTTFRKVVWPLALPGVFAAFLLTFVPAVGDYVNASILGGPGNTMIGNVIQSTFLTNFDYPIAAAMSFILMAALLVGATIYAQGARHRGRHGGGGGGMSQHPENPASVAYVVDEFVDQTTPPPKTPSNKRWTRFILPTYTTLFILYLIVPIAVMIVFAFNTPSGRYNIKWEHASLDAWRNLFSFPDLSSSLKLTLEVALLATIFSTILGTFIGLALGRYRFRGAGAMNFVIFLAIASPEIVLGSSMLTMFVNARVPQGFITILLAHVMFCVSFVAITVRARVSGMDKALEEAAGDLGADPTHDVLQGDAPAHPAGRDRRRPARVRALHRRLRHHELRRGFEDDVPVLGLRRHAPGHPGAGQRHGHAPVRVRHPHRHGQLLATRIRRRGDEKRLAQDKARLAAAQTS